MRKPIAGAVFAAAVIAFCGPSHLHAAPAAVPPTCNGLSGQIHEVLNAVNQSVATAKTDVNASKSKYAPTYPQASLDQLMKAGLNLYDFNVGGNPISLAQRVQKEMQQVVVLLQRARYQTVASAGNNHTKESRNTFNAITAAIAKAEAVALQAARCNMDLIDMAFKA
jgi:hypothetical protein